jgi:putative ABC transport system substrate-binding protein
MRKRWSIVILTLGVGILCVPLAAGAQPAGEAWRIGYLSPAGPKDDAPESQAFREGLRALGYIEGQNVLIEFRYSGDRLEALPALAEELVHLKVDVILASSTAATVAAKGVTTSIPIVFAGVSDPVGSGLVASLPRPGGNITGMMDAGVDVVGKRLDLLKQLVPRLKRVAALGNPEDTLWEPVWREAQVAGRQLGIDLVPVPITAGHQLEIAFKVLGSRVQALFVAPQPAMFVHRRRIIELAALARLPAVYEFRTYVADGGLMSYGPNYPALYRKAARHVDRILKGARPADLPVEQPTEWALVINLKTAKALGLTIPGSLLLRADELIK